MVHQARPEPERLEVADIFRRFGPGYLQRHQLSPHQAKVLRRVIACRTAALGGHLLVCDSCSASWPRYNACRDRHCPTCQGSTAIRWLAERLDRVVPTHHFHVVVTVPAELHPLCLANQRLLYDMLYAAVSETLLELARDAWDAVPAITAVLHTWTRQMTFHPHIHCIVTGGGLADDDRWVASSPRFLFPVKVISALVRGKFMDRLLRAHRNGELRFVGTAARYEDPEAFAVLRDKLYRAPWVAYAKRPFGDVDQVIRYLSRYTHRVAISSSRLVSIDDDAIVFRTRGHRLCRVHPDEFIRRFLLHVLPENFRKIRHYGLSAPSNVANGRLVLAQQVVEPEPQASAGEQETLTFDVPRDEVPAAPVVGEPCPCCGAGTVLQLAIDGLAARGPP